MRKLTACHAFFEFSLECHFGFFCDFYGMVHFVLFVLFSSSVADSPPDAPKGVSEFRTADKSCRDLRGCVELLAVSQSKSFQVVVHIPHSLQASTRAWDGGKISTCIFSRDLPRSPDKWQ